MGNSRLATETILLVDDEPANLQILMETLQNLGCKLLVAKNGESALSISKKASPDLVLLDIMMPGIDGFEVCRRLKLNATTADTPVIFLSSLSDITDKVKGFQSGAVDYITKPFQAEEVMARVNTHLTIHRLGRQLQQQKNQLERELKIVSRLQLELLPETLPEIGGITMGVHYRTSLYSGGDYYDFVRLGDGRWGLLLADAEGHGAPAAVMMAMTCTLFRSFPKEPVDPAEVLTFLNRHLRQAYGASFVTAIYAVFDPVEKTLTTARAGHPLPMVYRASDLKVREWQCPGVLPLGIEGYGQVPVATLRLQSGDRLLLYTDGVTERFNPDEMTYGEDRLLRQFEVATGREPNGLIEQIIEDLERFAQGRPADDDQALLLLVAD